MNSVRMSRELDISLCPLRPLQFILSAVPEVIEARCFQRLSRPVYTLDEEARRACFDFPNPMDGRQVRLPAGRPLTLAYEGMQKENSIGTSLYGNIGHFTRRIDTAQAQQGDGALKWRCLEIADLIPHAGKTLMPQRQMG